jgi:hypothetical protein
MPDGRDLDRVWHAMFEMVMARSSGIACGQKERFRPAAYRSFGEDCSRPSGVAQLFEIFERRQMVAGVIDRRFGSKCVSPPAMGTDVWGVIEAAKTSRSGSCRSIRGRASAATASRSIRSTSPRKRGSTS